MQEQATSEQITNQSRASKLCGKALDAINLKTMLCAKQGCKWRCSDLIQACSLRFAAGGLYQPVKYSLYQAGAVARVRARED